MREQEELVAESSNGTKAYSFGGDGNSVEALGRAAAGDARDDSRDQGYKLQLTARSHDRRTRDAHRPSRQNK